MFVSYLSHICVSVLQTGKLGWREPRSTSPFLLSRSVSGVMATMMLTMVLIADDEDDAEDTDNTEDNDNVQSAGS